MPEELAIRYVSLGEDAQFNIGILIVFIGFVVALIVPSKSKGELLRAPYYCISMLLVFLATVLSTTWLYGVEAMSLGILWVLAVANLIGTAVIGYFFGLIAKARSRDAYGTGHYALIGFIPLLNLLLVFKPSKKASSPNRIPTIPPLTGITGVILGLALFGASAWLTATLEIKAEEQIADVKTADSIEVLIKSIGLEETLEFMATGSQKDLPIVVDEVTQMVSIVAEGNRLKRTYVVSRDIVFSDHLAGFERAICAEESFAVIIRNGGAIEEIVNKPDGTPLGRALSELIGPVCI